MTETQRCSSGDQCIHPDGPDLPATNEFFYEDNRYDPPRLIKRCKKCKCKSTNETRSPEVSKRSADRYRKNHREECNQRSLNWSRTHKKHKQVYDRTYRIGREEHRNKNANDWKKNNPQQNRKTIYAWRKKNPVASRAISHRWRAIQRELPHEFTGEDLQFALNYFGGCAYCGHVFDESHKMTGDHFIPVSSPDCPGTIPENMLPTCHSCNFSKHNRRAEDWLSKKFGETESYLILQRIQSYFEHLRQLRNR